MLTTEVALKSEDLVAHCDLLLEILEPGRTGMKRYLGRAEVRSAIGFWWAPIDGPTGFEVPAPRLRRLTEFCDVFDFYVA